MAFGNIPIRENGKDYLISAEWFNSIRTELLAAFGTAGYVKESTLQSITAGGTIPFDADAFKPMINVQGNAAAVTTSTTPFGLSHGFTGGKEIILVGNNDTNSVTLEVNDIDEGFVGNGKVVLTKNSIVCLIYNATLKRFYRKDQSL